MFLSILLWPFKDNSPLYRHLLKRFPSIQFVCFSTVSTISNVIGTDFWFAICSFICSLCFVRVHSLQPHAKTVLATIHDQLLRTTQGGTNTQLCYYTNTCEHRLPVEVSNCIVFDIKVWSLMHTYQSIGITEKETKYKSICHWEL